MPDIPATPLLDAQGAASMATLFLMSHHGIRRDLALLQRSVQAPGDRAAALAAEWARFHATLHAHHESEDAGMFPGMRVAQPMLAVVFDLLTADHRRLDSLLGEGDAVFERLRDTGHGGGAAGVLAQIHEVLFPHLLLEERQIAPLLRAARSFDAPVPDALAAQAMADGVAWSALGVHPEIVEAVAALLPTRVRELLPASRAAHAGRFARAFGDVRAGASRTATPDWI